MSKYNQISIFCVLLLVAVACQQKQPVIRQYSVLNILEHSLINAQKSSNRVLKRVKIDVKKGGNAREGLERIKRAELLEKRVVDILGNIEKLKQRLIKEAGDGLDEKNHMPKRPLDVSTTARIMKENGEQLSKELNKFTRWLGNEYKDLVLFKLVLLGAGQDELSFYATWFEGANLGEVLVTLTKQQIEVMRYQAKILTQFDTGNFL